MDGKISKRRESSDGEKDDEDDVEDESEPEDLRSILRDMLSDADDMPVQMDEATVLRVHLRALDWADKARKILPACISVSAVNSNSANPESVEVEGSDERQELDHSSDDDEKVMKGKPKSGNSKSKEIRKPSFQEVQKLVNEIKS